MGSVSFSQLSDLKSSSNFKKCSPPKQQQLAAQKEQLAAQAEQLSKQAADIHFLQKKTVSTRSVLFPFLVWFIPLLFLSFFLVFVAGLYRRDYSKVSDKPVSQFGSLGVGDGQFHGPSSVTCNSRGEIVVADEKEPFFVWVKRSR